MHRERRLRHSHGGALCFARRRGADVERARGAWYTPEGEGGAGQGGATGSSGGAGGAANSVDDCQPMDMDEFEASDCQGLHCTYDVSVAAGDCCYTIEHWYADCWEG